MRISRSVMLGSFAVFAAAGLTGCAAGGAAGVGCIALAAAAFALGCGGQAISQEDDTEADASDASPLPDSNTGVDAVTEPDGSPQVDVIPVDSTPPEDAQPDAPACDGTCPSGMTCVQVASGSWCMPDADRDELIDSADNCPYAANSGQQDADKDGVGDACDACSGPNDTTSCGVECCNDPDGDGIAGTNVWGSVSSDKDNCPYIPNPGQQDGDNDGVGAACDLCQTVPNFLSPCGDPCLDSDGDGVADFGYCKQGDTDTCQFNPSDHFDDTDKDNIGDVCDPDGIHPLAMRLRILERLLGDGVLERGTVELATTSA